MGESSFEESGAFAEMTRYGAFQCRVPGLVHTDSVRTGQLEDFGDGDRSPPAGRIVDGQETVPEGRRRPALALAAVTIVLLVFAATLEPVQRTARVAMGLAGLTPLAVTLSGMVEDESGAPVAHAFVRVFQDRALATTYTDERGAYQMAFSIRTEAPADVSVGANGYEASLRAIRVASTEPHYDARLHAIVRIDAGATVHLVVAPEDGLCYPLRNDARERARSWPCRLVRVTTRETGVLTVAVVADDQRGQFGVTFAVGSQPFLVFATPCCAPDSAALLPAGIETIVQVVALDLDTAGASHSGLRQRSFTLQTTLEPP